MIQYHHDDKCALDTAGIHLLWFSDIVNWAVYNRWTGPVDWTSGLDYWTHPFMCLAIFVFFFLYVNPFVSYVCFYRTRSIVRNRQQGFPYYEGAVEQLGKMGEAPHLPPRYHDKDTVGPDIKLK